MNRRHLLVSVIKSVTTALPEDVFNNGLASAAVTPTVPKMFDVGQSGQLSVGAVENMYHGGNGNFVEHLRCKEDVGQLDPVGKVNARDVINIGPSSDE